MPFVRPIVEVFQEFATVTVSPAVPDLNCCIVGPAFHIQDYPVDAEDIAVSPDFIKTGYTKDAACGADGSSAGRPDPGATFLTLTSPPNHTPGATLDAASVDLVLDEAFIELCHGAGGAIADDANTFTSAGAGFVANKVAAGDRIVLSKSDGTVTIVKYVKSVTNLTTLELTSTKKSTELIGNASIRWRVEHELSDQHVDDAYFTVVGNVINILTGSTGLRLSYESATWPVNFGKIYVGYRELRTDIQSVQILNSTAEIASKIGRVDERNPLAVGAFVAFTNTNTPLQVFGVATDDSTGHLTARDRMSTRDDIYAIVPVSDSLGGSSWTTGVLAMWKKHCVDFSVPEKSKFRILLGSYDELPAQKSSAPPSDEGYTESATADLVDVFVDPNATTEFVTKGVGSSHLLDIARSASIQTLSTTDSFGDTPFKTGYAAKTLLGAIGEKRLRLAAAISAVAAQAGDYAVRAALTLRLNVTSGLTEGHSGDFYTITGSAGTFTGAAVNDIAALTDASAGVTNDGFRISAVEPDGSKITLDLKVTGKTGITVKVKTYRLSDVGGSIVVGCGLTSSTRRVTKTDAFANAAIGDIALILRTQHTEQTAGNVGLWVVSAVDAGADYITLGGAGTLTNDAGTSIVVALIPAISARGGASITTRKRLTRLRDNSATFLTTVLPAELIEIPYPVSVDPLHWDTAKTYWPIESIISNELLAADLEPLEELAPEDFIAGFNGDCDYRIAINLDPDAQVTELNTITTSLSHMRCVMVWPNEVSLPPEDVENALTGTQSHQKGWYLACALGGMIASLPSHQGFTYIGIGGIAQLHNSNFYFTDGQLTALRNGGWMVFVQDSENSLPYTIHEVTTNVTAYEYGELMHVKNFDYIALYMKAIITPFLGQYNIMPETLADIQRALMGGAQYLMVRKFPKIGAPLLDAGITLVEQTQADRLEIYMTVDMPGVLNQVGLHLMA